MSRPNGSIKRTIYISWDEAIEALEDITNNLGLGNHGDLFSQFDVNRLRELEKFVKKEISEYEEARKKNQER